MRAVLAACAALAAGSALAQSPAPAPEYDLAAEVTLRGEVTEIHESKVATDHPGLHFVLKTQLEALEVHVCPVRFLRELEFTIETGDELTVLGSRPKATAWLVAREIKKGQQSLILRDATGAPNWLPR